MHKLPVIGDQLPTTHNPRKSLFSAEADIQFDGLSHAEAPIRFEDILEVPEALEAWLSSQHTFNL